MIRLFGPVVLLVCSLGAPLLALSTTKPEPFPHVQVQTLSGRPLTLPEGIAGRGAFLVIGFSQASEKQTVVWRRTIQRDFSGHSGPLVYPVIVIQGIPSLFHGFLLAGVRHGVAREMWDRFLVVSENESSWKRVVGWKGPDVAYLLLLNTEGEIVWRDHGPFNVSAERSLLSAVSYLGTRPSE